MTSGGDTAENEAVTALTQKLTQSLGSARIQLIAYGGGFSWMEYESDDTIGGFFNTKSRMDTRQDAISFLKKVNEELVAIGIPENRISSSFGGYRENRRDIDIFYIPMGGEPPKPNPNITNDNDPDELTSVFFDEFEKIPQGDLIARTGFVAQNLSKDNSKFGLIKISGGNESNPSFPYFIESVFRGDLSFRKIPQERLQVQQCSANREKFRVRVYLSDRKLPIKPCDEEPLSPAKTTLFDSIDFHYDNVALTAYEEVGFDPYSNPNGEYSRRVFDTLKNIVDMSGGSLHLVSYLGTNEPYEGFSGNDHRLKKRKGLDPKPMAQEMLTSVKKEMVAAEIDEEKIRTLEGGYVNGDKRVEIWFVPEGGRIPKPKPNYFPRKKIVP